MSRSKSNKKAVEVVAAVEAAPEVLSVLDTIEAIEAVDTVEVIPTINEVIQQAQQQIVENQQMVVTANRRVTKVEISRKIFTEELAKGNMVRKDVIAKIMAATGLSKAGAGTYFQNLKDEFNLVKHRTA